MGGIAAAVEAYRTSPTPNVIMIEIREPRRRHPRRPRFARRGLRRRHPRDRHRPAQRRRALSRADAPRRQRLPDRAGRHDRRRARDLRPVLGARTPSRSGRMIAVVGAKGGVGASTIAHNIAWAIARDLQLDTVVDRSRSRLRHRRPRFQPGPAAGHRRRGVLAGPHRHQLHRPPAVEMHRPPEPAGGAGDARPGLRLRRPRRSTRSSMRCARPCPASCSTCRINGPAGPSAR